MLGTRVTNILYVMDLPLEQGAMSGHVATPVARRDEERIFRTADFMLVFGTEMENVIKTNYTLDKAEFIHFEMLDYMVAKPPVPKKGILGDGVSIVYAGALPISTMRRALESLPCDESVPIEYHFYGPAGEWTTDLCDRFHYHGPKDAASIIKEVNGYDFGLILRNLNSDAIAKYHNLGSTSKFSLYIAAGVPVLVPRQFGYPARMVERYGVGLVFDSPSQIPEIIERGRSRYMELAVNVRRLQARVTSGYFFKSAIMKIILSSDLDSV